MMVCILLNRVFSGDLYVNLYATVIYRNVLKIDYTFGISAKNKKISEFEILSFDFYVANL